MIVLTSVFPAPSPRLPSAATYLKMRRQKGHLISACVKSCTVLASAGQCTLIGPRWLAWTSTPVSTVQPGEKLMTQFSVFLLVLCILLSTFISDESNIKVRGIQIAGADLLCYKLCYQVQQGVQQKVQEVELVLIEGGERLQLCCGGSPADGPLTSISRLVSWVCLPAFSPPRTFSTAFPRLPPRSSPVCLPPHSFPPRSPFSLDTPA
ncbi:uncharacterized protein LOC119905559 isoform X1 [Micropterus salmoides]|uniref:uncharacterized protein LOC119905559 isoform X1 n=1 Tax=Micropterus salmoides TaxID=27706 RepID=UPI0018ED9431|nr:uncharacterized protein LOC119905559 isoform X1 [Micropterus salmoides]